MTIRPFAPADEDAVIALWNACGLVVPTNDPHCDIARKCAWQPNLFFVGLTADGTLAATVMAGYEGHRGWLNYLAVAPTMRKQGCGRQIAEHAIDALRNCGCPKINLQIRAANEAVITFYARLGFTVDPVISMGKRLIFDSDKENA